MDSEHRHELKTNELADWIAHFPDWFREHGKWIAAVVLLIAAYLVIRMGMNWTREVDLDRQARATMLIESLGQTKYNLLQNTETAKAGALLTKAEELEIAARDTEGPTKALLLIKQGHALRSYMHFTREMVEPTTVQEYVAQAQQAYEQARQAAEGAVNQAELQGLADLGLALCLEELGEYDKARQAYQAIMDNPLYEATIVPRQAGLRLDMLADNTGVFIFADAPAPEPATEDAGTPLPDFGPAIDIESMLQNPSIAPGGDQGLTEPTQPTEQPAQEPAATPEGAAPPAQTENP